MKTLTEEIAIKEEALQEARRVSVLSQLTLLILFNTLIPAHVLTLAAVIVYSDKNSLEIGISCVFESTINQISRY